MPALKYIPNYSVHEYRQWQGDWELWDGVPVAMSPSPFGWHQWVATSLAASIKNQLDEQHCDDCFVLMETDWIVNDRTVVRPDISVCCDSFPERFIESAPALVIEVLSESTAEKDRHSKRLLYELEHVPFYLIVDIENDRFEFHQRHGKTFGAPSRSGRIEFDLHDGCNLALGVPQRPA